MKTIPTLLILSLLLAVPATAAPVTPDAFSGSDWFTVMIPVAGRTPGAGGETFVTDLTLVNYRDVAQRVIIRWLPQGGTADPQELAFELAAHAFTVFPDILGNQFGLIGVGALQITGVNATGTLDPGAEIDAHARIWTNTTCADLSGTVSQSVPAILPGTWRAASGAYVHGPQQSGQYRTNYGIVNLGSSPQSFRVIVSSQQGRAEEMVTVPALGTIHRPVPAGVGGQMSIFVEPADPMTASTGWRIYATTVDNRSGSGWTMIGIQPRTDVETDQ